MAYFFRKFQGVYSDTIIIRIPSYYNILPGSFKSLLRHSISFLIIFFQKWIRSVFFTEYLSAPFSGEHHLIAGHCKKKSADIKIIALIHIPLYLAYKINYGINLEEYLNVPHEIIVFGSSLKSELMHSGIKKVTSTHHYVDTKYYRPIFTPLFNMPVKIVIIGDLLRNKKLLHSIISECDNIYFYVFTSDQDFIDVLSQYSHVYIFTNVKEEVLLKIMQESDISLSCMTDSIGSNVITTSLACGLALVASDTGSIRDYCSEENSILCNHKEDFVFALNLLNNNRDKLDKMKISSRKKALEYDIENSMKIFNNILEGNDANK